MDGPRLVQVIGTLALLGSLAWLAGSIVSGPERTDEMRIQTTAALDPENARLPAPSAP